MQIALSRWALLLGLLVGGCAAGPSAAIREPRTAGDQCTASGRGYGGCDVLSRLERPI
jgi:hypothetical protein